MKKVLYKLFTCLSTTRSKQGVLCPRRCNIRFCFLLPCQESSRATYHPLGHDDLAMRITSTAADRRLPQISQGCLATCRQLLRPRKICSVIHQRVLRLCKNIRQPIADYSSFMRVLGDPQAITSTSLRIVDMSSTTSTIWLHQHASGYFNYSVAHRQLLSVRPVFISRRLVPRVPTDGALRPNFSVRPVFTSYRLVLCVPTDGVLHLNSQYGQCLLVID